MIPARRTITIAQFEPWLLGWCRWEITTELHHVDYVNGSTVVETLAAGRWRWRGRRAPFVEARVGADLYWTGNPIPGRPPLNDASPARTGPTRKSDNATGKPTG